MFYVFCIICGLFVQFWRTSCLFFLVWFRFCLHWPFWDLNGGLAFLEPYHAATLSGVKKALCYMRIECATNDRAHYRVRIQSHQSFPIASDLSVTEIGHTSSEWCTGFSWVPLSTTFFLHLNFLSTAFYHFFQAPWDAIPTALCIFFTSSTFHNSLYTILKESYKPNDLSSTAAVLMNMFVWCIGP